MTGTRLLTSADCGVTTMDSQPVSSERSKQTIRFSPSSLTPLRPASLRPESIDPRLLVALRDLRLVA